MITIVADTLSCISVETAARIGVPLLPQIIIFGEQTFRDDTEIDSATFLTKLRASSELPKTAAPPPALYTPIYEQYAMPGNTVIVLSPTGKLSGTFRSATVAAQDFPNADIRVVDTLTIGAGLGTLVYQALAWRDQGLDADVIVQKVTEMAGREKLFILVDTLEYLYKGGRIGGAKMFLGSLLQTKPLLQLKEGAIQPLETQRTKKRALARLEELVKAQCPPGEQSFLAVMEGDAKAEAALLAEQLAQDLGMAKVPVHFLPPAVLVHAGPGALGISFFPA
jgi:DegV family protein with EDD domain